MSGLAGLMPLAVGLAIGIGVAVSLAPTPYQKAAAVRAAQAGLALPAGPLEDGGAQERRVEELVAEARALLAKGAYEELDATFAKHRTARSRFADGAFYLSEMYRDLAEPANAKIEGSWTAMAGQIEAWVKARPKSVAAHAAHAHALTAWGWHARGTGWSSTVTEDGRQKFQERLALAEAACEAAAAADPKAIDPYFVWLRLGTGLSFERAKMETIARRGLAIEPEAFALHRQMVVFLLPRWYGSQGDWEAYAERAAGADDALYARIATAAAMYEKAEVFKVARVSWARIAKGMQKLVHAHPTSSTMLSRFAWWAWIAEDRMIAKAAFARLQDRFEPSIWRTRKQLDAVRAWALR